VIENLAHIREQFERMSTDSKQLTAAFYEFVPPLKQDLMQFRIEAIERISRIPTQDALILVSTDGYVLAASSSLIDVLGVSPQTVVGLPFDWLIYDPRSITSGESFHKHYLIETVVKTQQIVPNYVMGLYHQQYGKHVWVRVSCEPYFNYTPHGREMIGVLVLLHAESDFVVSEERGSDV
jgi:PAS domain-containing protein